MTGDDSLGGYRAAHCCPPTFLGSDGVSYSAEVYVDGNPLDDGSFGAALLFIRWSGASAHPEGHLETGYVARGDTQDEARAAAECLTLHSLKENLDRLIAERKGRPGW